MRNKVLVIVPTKNRRDKVIEFYSSWKLNSTISDLVFPINDDDTSYDGLDFGENTSFIKTPARSMNEALNYTAVKFSREYRWLSFMGDDHRTKTFGWDASLTEGIPTLGVAYGNDLIQKENLPTAVVLTSNIVSAIGYMAPPTLRHLYLDNFWLDLGKRIGRLYYRDDVIIEHMHYTVGKSQADQIYQEVNSSGMFERDRIAYESYKQTLFEQDIHKIYDFEKERSLQ